MASPQQHRSPEGKDGIQEEDEEVFVLVRKRDLERLRSEVVQLRDALPRLVHRDVNRMLRRARATKKKMEFRFQDMDRLQQELDRQRQELDRQRQELDRQRQECLHLCSRLETLQNECQREREGKLVLREQLWASREQLQQQAEFCVGLGASTCTLLWSVSGKEEAVTDILADGQLQSFLGVAGQTLESFVRSQDDEEEKTTESHQENNSCPEQQFVLAVAGVIANIAAVTCGRDYLSSGAPVLLDTLMQLLMTMKTGVCPRLKVLMLMALYNVSISVKGLKYISESPGLLDLIWNLLEDGDWEVCVNALRLLQSLLLEKEAVCVLGPGALSEPGRMQRVRELSLSRQPALKHRAQEALLDLQALMETREDH